MRRGAGLALTRAILIALPLALACAKGQSEDEEESPADDTPATPAPGTLSIDLSTDDDAQSLVESAGLNHGATMIVLAAVNVSLAAQVAVPVAMLKKAATTEPEYVAENTWVWSFDAAVSGNTWTGNLTGVKLSEASASWSMSVTNATKDANGCCTDFKFFDGTTTTASAGTWQIFDPTQPSAGAKLFQISYDYRAETDKTVTYSVNSDKPSTEKFGQGSSVVYRATSTDVTVIYDDSAETGERTIAWDRTTKAGSHTDNTGAKVCWGPEAGGFANVVCP